MKLYVVLLALTFPLLLVSDHLLYTHLTPLSLVELAALRIFLLLVPVLASWYVHHVRSRAIRIAARFAWFVFFPYTLYSVMEIRHVAELCRLPQGFYTTFCAADLWTLLPLMVYALAGLVGFVLSLRWMLGVIRVPTQRRILELAAILWAALCSVLGIITRFNAWDIVVHPASVLQTVSAAPWGSVVLNTIAYALFGCLVYYGATAFKNMFGEKPS